jgi:hypothetical protein
MDIVEEQIWFSSEGLRLEGRLAYPDACEPETVACLLAPHPFFGGDLENNVIAHVSSALAARGVGTLRFNYRGVGESEVNLPEGTTCYAWFEAMENERRYEVFVPDAVAAMACLCEAVPDATNRFLIGYSFGAVLAGMAASQTPATAIVAISPPVTRVPLDVYDDCALPKYFLAGNMDFVFDEGVFLEAYQGMPDPKAWIPMPGCDHFYRGDEARLAAEIIKAMGR